MFHNVVTCECIIYLHDFLNHSQREMNNSGGRSSRFMLSTKMILAKTFYIIYGDLETERVPALIRRWPMREDCIHVDMADE